MSIAIMIIIIKTNITIVRVLIMIIIMIKIIRGAIGASEQPLYRTDTDGHSYIGTCCRTKQTVKVASHLKITFDLGFLVDPGNLAHPVIVNLVNLIHQVTWI